MRLRRADCSSPGITRRRRGRGFEYVDAGGRRMNDDETLMRIRELGVPPAWRNVWICTDPKGHLQATGVDAAGRKQYLYHPIWRARRDREKFDRMLEFANALPRLRRQASRHLVANNLSRERVLACAVRLLDRGFFRVGGEDYAGENGTFGLATMQRRHVSLGEGHIVTFDYEAKGRKQRVQYVVDADVYAVVAALERRRGGTELLAYRNGRRWVDVRSDDINQYIRHASGGPFTAKDFRTWNGTVLAAVGLAVASGTCRSRTARKRAASHVVKEVARYLGNTPAVCRASYIDPRVFDRFDNGVTIAGVLEHLGEDPSGPQAQRTIERAVLALLEERLDAPAIEQAQAA